MTRRFRDLRRKMSLERRRRNAAAALEVLMREMHHSMRALRALL